jgi:hypothetical protein
MEAGQGSRALRLVAGAVLAGMLVAGAVRKSAANDVFPILPFTGAPGDPATLGGTCNFPGGCHEAFEVNSGPGSLTLELPSSYVPGETYLIRVDLAQEGQLRWGFQMTAIDAELFGAGTLAPTDANAQVQDFSGLGTDRSYVAHTEAGTAAGQLLGNSWNVQWTAPDTDVGPVTFYVAGNAADNNDAQTGNDYIYNTNVTIPAPEPGALAAGLLGLSAAAALARWKDRPRWKGRARGVA